MQTTDSKPQLDTTMLKYQELEESSYLLQSIVDNLHTCTYIVNPETHVLKFVNQNTQHTINDAQPGALCYKTLRGKEQPCQDCPIKRMLKNGFKSDQSEMYLEGYGMWALINASLVTVPDGKTYGVFTGFDFSNQKRKDSLRSEEYTAFLDDASLFDALSLSTEDYIYIYDVKNNIFCFPQTMVTDFGFDSRIIHDAMPFWSTLIHEDDFEEFSRGNDQILSGKTDDISAEFRMLNTNGNWVWIRGRGHMERDSQGNPHMFAGVLTKLGKKSKIDPLTGLPDRYEFELHTKAALRELPSKGALILLDLDNFRYINSIYGWSFGDKVLYEAAHLLQSSLPQRAQLYRLDSDKFAVFLPEVELDQVRQYYQTVLKNFQRHREVDESRFFCTLSAGCGFFSEEKVSFDIMFKQALDALESSKRNGKNRFTLYCEETMGGNDRIISLINALQQSVDEDCSGFSLHYQPQINPETSQVVSAEALLRWQNPVLGSVSPVEFIPILEQTGLIHKVGAWVLVKAAKTCKEWQSLVPNFSVSVNVSFAQLQDQEFLPYLKKQIDKGIIDPSAVHLEITESCIASGSKSLTEAFSQLRDLGFTIEMDDFGTGYSSLEILKNAPADVVKIDRVFVRDITNSNFDITFIKFIVALCHSVNIKVCLEGVENQEEYYLVEPMGLDLIQGFFFGKPQPKEIFEKNFLSKSE